MPYAAPHPCNKPGCGKLTNKRFCEEHTKTEAKHNWQSDKVRGNRHHRGYGNEWERIRKVVLKRDTYLCQPCLKEGRVKAAIAVDHITPKAQGGTDDEWNLQSICNPCHLAKTARERNGN